MCRNRIEPGQNSQPGVAAIGQKLSVGWRVHGIKGPGLRPDQIGCKCTARIVRHAQRRGIDQAIGPSNGLWPLVRRRYGGAGPKTLGKILGAVSRGIKN